MVFAKGAAGGGTSIIDNKAKKGRVFYRICCPKGPEWIFEFERGGGGRNDGFYGCHRQNDGCREMGGGRFGGVWRMMDVVWRCREGMRFDGLWGYEAESGTSAH